MCGYYGYFVNEWLSRPFPEALPLESMGSYAEGHRYNRQRIEGHISRSSIGEGLEFSSPLWWYQLKKENCGDGKFRQIPDYRYTTFNARDLDSQYWKSAVNERRGIVVASQIGESRGKERFLMRAERPLLIATVFKDWPLPEGRQERSCALITRDPLDGFAHFHPKSTPLFLPDDQAAIELWLSDAPASNPAIQELLALQHLPCSFLVQPVASYKDAKPRGEASLLSADGGISLVSGSASGTRSLF